MAEQSKPVYDLSTAIKFFLVGLGVGTVLAVILSRADNKELTTSAPALAHGAS